MPSIAFVQEVIAAATETALDLLIYTLLMYTNTARSTRA